MYKLSIITINYNNASGLHSTIESIISQSFKNFEYCIIDGGSTDGSRKIIEQYQKDINIWVSEKDKGIYHAMNKGIRASHGEYILFLNSGDTLNNKNVLEEVFLTGEDLIYGNLNVIDLDKEWLKTYPAKLTFEYFLKDTLPHPATFIKKNLFDVVGSYNETNMIVSDWEYFMLAICKYNCSYKHIPLTVSNFMLDGISSKDETSTIRLDERIRALKKYFPAFLSDYEELEKLRKEILRLHNSKAIKLSQKIKNLLKR